MITRERAQELCKAGVFAKRESEDLKRQQKWKDLMKMAEDSIIHRANQGESEVLLPMSIMNQYDLADVEELAAVLIAQGFWVHRVQSQDFYGINKKHDLLVKF